MDQIASLRMSDSAMLLRQHADRCRRLAEGTEDARTSRILKDMAVDYERRAKDLDGPLLRANGAARLD